ncbi:MAG: protein kinase [Pirellulales bacterium]|nr:protein kinase [Pirellulales bacterium]
MSTDPTQIQQSEERLVSREMSLKRGRPPTQVPGYDPERFLGMGAYGEVWVAIERNTGRRVAIKFYSHRGGLDWSLLSREVEKLAFLFADRYVVQLLAVGWDSTPPYYVMEYLEKGSLADRLHQGPLPVDAAVEMFREVAIGLVHAHGKGVLHCDLKPANILLDQDNKPRLADFGQSRLSNEQMPALGTMFYMAPEQADLDAVPDAQWDVYALGALLYCMLTGNPPHRTGETAEEFDRTPELRKRLERYRHLIEQAPPPEAHRQSPGVDSQLADIVDRCLAFDPRERYPNVQAVLGALDDRAARRARRPMMILGAVGPILLLAVVAWFSWRGFSAAMQESNAALTRKALESNGFAAKYIARTAAKELDRRFQLVEQVAGDDRLLEALKAAFENPELREMSAKLGDPKISEAEKQSLREKFRDNPDRKKLQKSFSALIPPSVRPRSEEEVQSWFFCDAQGISTVRVPEGSTLGKDFAWRSFFHGGPRDRAESWRPEPGKNLRATAISAVFRSQATAKWVVAVSTPVFDDSPEKKFLGVVAYTSEVGKIIEEPDDERQFAVVADLRAGDNPGVILQHPLFKKMIDNYGKLPDRFKDYRVSAGDLPNDPQRERNYDDPLSKDAEGAIYDRHWLARMEPIKVRDEKTGWVVIVQKAYDEAIGTTLSDLRRGLIRYGIAALSMIALVMALLWAWTLKMSAKRRT